MKKLFLILPMVFFAVNCAKTDNPSPSTQQTPHNYTGANGTGYSMNNGQCVSQVGGQVVSNSYCTGNGIGTGTGTQTRCLGYYTYQSANGPIRGYCDGFNCRGYTLTDSNGQQVTCI